MLARHGSVRFSDCRHNAGFRRMIRLIGRRPQAPRDLVVHQLAGAAPLAAVVVRPHVLVWWLHPRSGRGREDRQPLGRESAAVLAGQRSTLAYHSGRARASVHLAWINTVRKFTAARSAIAHANDGERIEALIRGADGKRLRVKRGGLNRSAFARICPHNPELAQDVSQ